MHLYPKQTPRLASFFLYRKSLSRDCPRSGVFQPNRQYFSRSHEKAVRYFHWWWRFFEKMRIENEWLFHFDKTNASTACLLSLVVVGKMNIIRQERN